MLSSARRGFSLGLTADPSIIELKISGWATFMDFRHRPWRFCIWHAWHGTTYFRSEIGLSSSKLLNFTWFLLLAHCLRHKVRYRACKREHPPTIRNACNFQLTSLVSSMIRLVYPWSNIRRVVIMRWLDMLHLGAGHFHLHIYVMINIMICIEHGKCKLTWITASAPL